MLIRRWGDWCWRRFGGVSVIPELACLVLYSRNSATLDCQIQTIPKIAPSLRRRRRSSLKYKKKELKMVRVSILVSRSTFFPDWKPLNFMQNDCLNNIVNAERRGKRQVLIRPSSKVVVKFLSVMQRHGEQSNTSVGLRLWSFELVYFYSIQDTLVNLRSSMTIAQAKSSFNSTAISTKRVSFLLASTSNILKLSPGSTCCYLLEVSDTSSSYVYPLSPLWILDVIIYCFG